MNIPRRQPPWADVPCWAAVSPSAWQPPVDNDAKLLAWRRSGVAMWLRSPSQGPWGFHGHGIWIGCPHVSSGAANQVTAYRNGRNGLASNARDNGPRPGVVTWSDALDAWQGGGSPKPPAPELKDFPDPGPQIFETVRKNPHGVILYGISDQDLAARLQAHGFDRDWYGGNLAWTLVDFARSLGHLPQGAELVGRLHDAPSSGIVWVDHRQQYEAAMNGGVGSHREASIHAVRAIQAGLKKFGHDVVEDGIYGPQTRGAVADWQVSRRGAARGKADGIARVSDAMHLGFSIGVRTRHTM